MIFALETSRQAPRPTRASTTPNLPQLTHHQNQSREGTRQVDVILYAKGCLRLLFPLSRCDALDRLRVPALGSAWRVATFFETATDPAERHSGAAKFSGQRDHGFLAWFGLDVFAVAREAPAVGSFSADPLAPRALHGEGRFGARFDREPFVLGERVDDATHEQSFGSVGVPAPIDRSNGGAELLGALFDQRSDQRVARQAIARGHQQDAGAVLLHAGKRCAGPRALVGRRRATNGLIEKYGNQRAAVRLAPREQGAALCLGTERLLAGAYSYIANDFTRVAWGS
jgi:hypothetical protein